MTLDRTSKAINPAAATPKSSSTSGSPGGSQFGDETLKQLYANMLKCRVLGERVAGEGSASGADRAATIGQEATLVGCTVNLQPDDILVWAGVGAGDLLPGSVLTGLLRGEPFESLLSRMKPPSGPRANGSASRRQREHPLETAASRAGKLGECLALAGQRTRKESIAVAFCSEDVASAGEWRAALQTACSDALPILFVVQNNPWPTADRKKSRRTEAIRLQADRYGIPGIPIDGNDAVAVYRVAYEAIERARRGGGPTLMECTTHSWVVGSPGVAGKESGRGPKTESTAVWRNETDPIQYMEQYLTRKELFAQAWKNQLIGKFRRSLNRLRKNGSAADSRDSSPG